MKVVTARAALPQRPRQRAAAAPQVGDDQLTCGGRSKERVAGGDGADGGDQVSGAGDFSRKPLAPARIAPKTYSSKSNVVTAIVQAGAFAEHTIEAVRYTACRDGSWLGGLYDYGHGEPAMTEEHAVVSGPWLTVFLPASTRIRLTLKLALRTRPPSYATPFDDEHQNH